MSSKSKQVPIRMTEEEYSIIEAKAAKLGLTVSAYLRMLGLKE